MKYQKYYINRQDKGIPLIKLYHKIWQYNIFLLSILYINLFLDFSTFFIIVLYQISTILLFYKFLQKLYLQYIDYRKILVLLPIFFTISYLFSWFGVAVEFFTLFLLLINFKNSFNFFYKNEEIEEWIVDYRLNDYDISFKNYKSYKITIENDVRDGFMIDSACTSFLLEDGKYRFAVSKEIDANFFIEIKNNEKTIFKKDSVAFEDGWNELIIDGGSVEIIIDGNFKNIYFQIPNKIKKQQKLKTIVLIVSDALTKDDMSVYGGGVNVPHIEEFFKDGCKFYNHFAQGEWTTTNFVHMLTGLYSSWHKSTHRYLNHKKSFRHFDTIASILKENGFNTFAYYTSKRMAVKFGYAKGFDKTIYKGYREVSNSDITYEAINFLNQHKDESCFLLLHYMDNHAPYHHWSFYRDFNTGLREKKIDDIYRKDKDFYSVYKNTIREFDVGIGVFLSYLKQNFPSADVLLTSDHGQFIDIPKSDLIGSIEPLLSDMMINIPLLIKSDKIDKNKNYKFSEAIDLYSTILEIADVKKSENSLINQKREKEFVVTESIYEGITQRVIQDKDYKYYRKFNWITKEEIVKIVDKKSNSFIEDKNIQQKFESIENDLKLMQKDDDYIEFYGRIK